MATHEPERRTDDDLRERLDAIQRSYDERIDRLSKGTFIALAAMVIIFLLGATSVTVLQVRKVDRADRAAEQAQASKELAQAIQQQRRDAARDSCLDAKQRNQNAIVQLRAIAYAAKQGASLERRRRIEQSELSSETVINALVPDQDCDARVEQVAPHPTPKKSP